MSTLNNAELNLVFFMVLMQMPSTFYQTGWLTLA